MIKGQRQEIFNIVDLFTSQPVIDFYAQFKYMHLNVVINN